MASVYAAYFSALRGSSLVAALAATGCATQVELDITLVDRETKAPLPNALISVEVGGIYVKNDDTSLGSPAYQYGGKADAAGKVRLSVPDDQLGFHVFAEGYRYRPYRVEGDEVLAHTIEVSPQLPEDRPPTVADVKLEPATVAAGGTFTISATVNAADPSGDPLSDETLAILEDGDFSVALDPPSAGVQGVGFPDGFYKKQLEAPAAPGKYTYFIVATSELCITSAPQSVVLTVQ